VPARRWFDWRFIRTVLLLDLQSLAALIAISANTLKLVQIP